MAVLYRGDKETSRAPRVAVTEYKTCTACRISLPCTEEFFSKNIKGRHNLRSQCRICDYIKKTVSRKFHREAKPWDKSVEDEYKRYCRMIYISYRVRESDIRFLMDKQKGCCAICGSSLANPQWSKSDMHIDHCHHTNKVRGLLCGNCNWLLGVAKEDCKILTNAISYLTKELL